VVAYTSVVDADTSRSAVPGVPDVRPGNAWVASSSRAYPLVCEGACQPADAWARYLRLSRAVGLAFHPSHGDNGLASATVVAHAWSQYEELKRVVHTLAVTPHVADGALDMFRCLRCNTVRRWGRTVHKWGPAEDIGRRRGVRARQGTVAPADGAAVSRP